MPDEIVKVENGNVTAALQRFLSGIDKRAELMRTIATGMYVSIRKTFREQGVPADSWAPLAASTLRKKPNGPGRKILIVSGRLLNSIQATSDDTTITIGTNLAYARVQQEGSADRGVGAGPQARIPGRSVGIQLHSRRFQREIHYGLKTVTGKDGKEHQVPVAQRAGKREITDARGRKTVVRAAYLGPKADPEARINVGAHDHFQNIPARPYLLFRPEDLPRIQAQVIDFGRRAAVQAGLSVEGAG